MHSVKEEVWLQLALQRLQSDFRQLCFELCRTKFSLPIPAVIQKRMCDEHNRNGGAGYVVHDTSEKHAFEKAPWIPEGMDMEKYVADIERSLLKSALAQSNGVQARAADVLKISYRSFRHLMKKYDL